MSGFNMKVTPEIERLTGLCEDTSRLDLSLYGKYDVKRGLRDLNGKGVLAGLTQISNVQAVKIVDGKEVPCAGSLSYRGYDIKELTRGFLRDSRFGFEETAYLLLFGSLPNKQELQDFYEDPENNQEVPRKYGAGYIYLSSYERNSYEVDEEALDRLYLKVFENKEAKVYRIR